MSATSSVLILLYIALPSGRRSTRRICHPMCRRRRRWRRRACVLVETNRRRCARIVIAKGWCRRMSTVLLLCIWIWRRLSRGR